MRLTSETWTALCDGDDSNAHDGRCVLALTEKLAVTFTLRAHELCSTKLRLSSTWKHQDDQLGIFASHTLNYRYVKTTS